MQGEWTPEEEALGAAQSRLAEAIDRTRRAGRAYFDAPLARSMDARDEYYDALQRQLEAERGLYEAKSGVSSSRPAPRTR